MTFLSLGFFAFLIIGIILFYVCPLKYRWVMLLAISTAFYVISGIEYLPFILFSTLTVYFTAGKIGKNWEKQDAELKSESLSREDKKAIRESYKKKSKKFLLLALLINIGILCAVKFGRFFVSPINELLSFIGGEGEFKASMIIVPLGISYYTFSVVGYLLDVYWKRYKYEKNYFRFLLFAIYFPHILQGPIARYNKLGTELKKELRFDFQNFIYGVQLMLWGYFKKLVIADRLNIFIDGALSELDNHGWFYIAAMVFDVFYIYADFSGCVDIARGVSQIFGVELEINFSRPFLSKDISEFWRRWHMTLNGWFKDYVYYPVSASAAVKKISKSLKKINSPKELIRIITAVIPVFVIWTLTGLWHGTGKTYLAWGLYYSVIMGASVAFGPNFQSLLKKLNIKTDTVSWSFLRMAKVFTIFMGGRMLISAGGLEESLYLFQTIFFNPNPWIFTNGTFWKLSELDGYNMLVAVLSLVIFVAVDIIQEKLEGESLRERISRENMFTGIILTVALTVAIFIFGVYGAEYDAASFVYMAY